MCGTGGTLINRFALKGFDDTLTVIKTVNIESRKSDELPVDHYQIQILKTCHLSQPRTDLLPEVITTTPHLLVD